MFWFLSKFAFDRLIVFCIDRKLGEGNKTRYWFVDCHVLVWVIFLSLLLFVFSDCAYKGIFRFLIAYRLFQIFQSWVYQFVLTPWEVRNVYRSLVLAFIGYWDITVSFALFYFILRDDFSGITGWQQAFHYSIRNAVTIGLDVQPISLIGYTIFVTQLLFALLFLTTVVNHVISYKR